MTKEKLWAEILRQTPNLEKDGIPGEKVHKFFDLVYNQAYAAGGSAAARASSHKRDGDTAFMESILGLFTSERRSKRWPDTGR